MFVYSLFASSLPCCYWYLQGKCHSRGSCKATVTVKAHMKSILKIYLMNIQQLFNFYLLTAF